MIAQFPNLHDREIHFTKFINILTSDDASLDENVAKEFYVETSLYSKEINMVLKKYAEINYKTEKKKKINAKAQLNYAYDFLSMLMAIVNTMEHQQDGNLDQLRDQLDLLEEFLYQKENLIETTYTKSAIMELDSFYNPEIRDQLESKLESMFKQKQQNGLK